MILQRSLLFSTLLVGLFKRNLIFAMSGECSASMSNNTYIPGTVSIVYVTTPNNEVAKKIAHGLVNNKLAACVNIIPNIVSVYEWEGKVNEDNEVLLLIKTRSSRVDDLTKYVKENHPYTICEVIAGRIANGNNDYLNWVTTVVPPSQCDK